MRFFCTASAFQHVRLASREHSETELKVKFRNFQILNSGVNAILSMTLMVPTRIETFPNHDK